MDDRRDNVCDKGEAHRGAVLRKSRLEVHLQMFIALCLSLKNIIHGEKEPFFNKNQSSDGGGDQNKLFGIYNLF